MSHATASADNSCRRAAPCSAARPQSPGDIFRRRGLPRVSAQLKRRCATLSLLDPRLRADDEPCSFAGRLHRQMKMACQPDAISGKPLCNTSIAFIDGAGRCGKGEISRFA